MPLAGATAHESGLLGLCDPAHLYALWLSAICEMGSLWIMHAFVVTCAPLYDKGAPESREYPNRPLQWFLRLGAEASEASLDERGFYLLRGFAILWSRAMGHLACKSRRYGRAETGVVIYD